MNERLSSKVEIEFPDFTKLSEELKQKFESLPTKVNFFRMLGHSLGTFVEIIDLTNAIFKNLKISDYHKELLVLMVASNEGSDYEWEQHVSIAQAGLKHNVSLPFNALSSTELFNSMGKEKPDAK